MRNYLTELVLPLVFLVFCSFGSYFFYVVTLDHIRQVSAKVEAAEHTVKVVKDEDLAECQKQQQANRADIDAIKQRLGMP